MTSERTPAPPARSGGLSQASLRTHNLAVVTRHAFAGDRPLSRAELAARTGLTRSTVSRLVAELVRAGILQELEPHEGRRGRPAIPLRPAGGTIAGLGLEISGHRLAGRLVDLTGTVLAEEVVPGDFERSRPVPVLTALGRLAGRLLAGHPAVTVAGARLALPGLVDTGGGRLLRAPNLGWTDVRPADVLTELLPVGLSVGNEADLAAVAHSLRAPGRPASASTFFYVSGDVGIGAATVVEGTLSRGVRGFAGEIGHTLVDPAGPVCTCGARGCLEVYAGRDAMLAAAGMPAGTSARTLADAARAGDRAAARALTRAGDALGVALANAVNLADVGDVVLGGDLRELFDHLRPAVEHQLAVRVLAAPWAQVRLRPAGPDPLPAVTGGALAALDRVISAPEHWAGGAS